MSARTVTVVLAMLDGGTAVLPAVEWPAVGHPEPMTSVTERPVRSSDEFTH